MNRKRILINLCLLLSACIIITIIFFAEFPSTCGEMDQVNLNPTSCSCVGIIETSICGVVGGCDSQCYGLNLGQYKFSETTN